MTSDRVETNVFLLVSQDSYLRLDYDVVNETVLDPKSA